MFTKHLLVFSIWFFSNFAVAAQVEKPYLYKVSTTHHDSYLFGTIHAEVYLQDLPPGVAKALENTEIFFPEIVLPNSEMETLEKTPWVYLENLRKKTLSKLPKIDDWSQNKLIEYGIPKEAAAMVTGESCDVLDMPLEYRPGQLAMDFELTRLAKSMGKTVMPLETEELREKADALDPIDLPCDFHSIFESLTPAEVFSNREEGLRLFAQIYRKGVEFKEKEDRSMVYRNEAWLPKIENAMEDHSVFVAAGVSHLFSEHGLIEMLRRDGYTVTRVEFANQ